MYTEHVVSIVGCDLLSENIEIRCESPDSNNAGVLSEIQRLQLDKFNNYL